MSRKEALTTGMGFLFSEYIGSSILSFHHFYAMN